MSSRVVHIRLDDWVLLGCHDILKANKESVDNIPMATIVRQVLTAIVRKLQSSGRIPTYTKEEAYERAMELYAGALEIDVDLDDAIKDLVAPTEDADDGEMAALVRETLRQIESEGDPEIAVAEEVIINEDAILQSEAEITTINLMDQKCAFTFAECRKQSPKDRFIEWADDKEEVIQKAVAVTYSGLPKQLWGTDKAEEMISGLLERHRAE